MRPKTSAIVAVVSIAVLMLTLGLPTAAARSTDNSPMGGSGGHTIVVLPNGVNDTANIQAAFNTCTSHGWTCTIQLVKGTYYTDQITAYGFQGSFVGVGQGQTNIVALGNMPSPNPSYNIPCEGYPTCTTTTGTAGGVPWWAGLPGPNNPWPALFTFEGGTFAISGMTMTDTSSTPTQGWYWPAVDGGAWNTALIAAIEITGLEAVATVDHVTIVGAAGDFAGFNMANGVHVEGSMLPSTWSNPEADTIPLTGTFSVTNSVFTNVETGPFANYLIDANVAFCHNTFTAPIASFSAPTFDFAAMDNSNTDVTVCGNVGTAVAGTALYIVQGVWKSDLLPSTIYVTGNDFQVDQGANAVDLFDFGPSEGIASTLSAVVSGNVFQTDTSCGCYIASDPSDYSVIISENLKSLVVSGNTILGGGAAGVYVVGGPAVVSGNTILGSYVGVWVDYANNVWVVGNLVKNSVAYGIAVTDGSSNNLVAWNIVKNSGVDDLYWDGTGTGNVWVGNIYGTSSPPGL